MRSTPILLGGLLALSLAACTSGSSPAPTEPSPATSAEPSPVTSAEPSAAVSPSAAAEPLALAVTFDGETCTYTGPTVVPEGTLTEFSYAAADGTEASVLVVGAVLPGTTWEQIVADVGTRAGSDVPDWFSQLSFINVEDGDSALYTLRGELGQSFGGYFVGCATTPESEGGSDRMFPAALIELGGA